MTERFHGRQAVVVIMIGRAISARVIAGIITGIITRVIAGIITRVIAGVVARVVARVFAGDATYFFYWTWLRIAIVIK
jgi:hypothetical protein